MLKIRLRRMGSTHRPFFRIVVSDSRRTPFAAAVEEVGYYNPSVEPKEIVLHRERIEHWISQGAQASPRVKQLMGQEARRNGAATEPATEPVAEPVAETDAESSADASAETAASA